MTEIVYPDGVPGDAPLVTFTISIGRNGDITSRTQTHGNSFADVYRGFYEIRNEVDRQIADRRGCPFNPKHGVEPEFDDG